MALKLMYITNNADVASIAEKAGVDRIFLDMEFIGKDSRQKGMDTVKNHHTIEDIRRVRKVLTKAELLVRCNPIHDKIDDYYSSKEEIEEIINAGADIIMLPFFKTILEIEKFLTLVNGRTKVMLLLETPEAVAIIDDILHLEGIDEIHVGLNDLSLGLGKSFMFELLEDGTIEYLSYKFRVNQMPFGFGGIAALGDGKLPAEKIIKEHYFFGSSIVILSRSFCDVDKCKSVGEIAEKFFIGIGKIRSLERECMLHKDFFNENRTEIKKIIQEVHTMQIDKK